MPPSAASTASASEPSSTTTDQTDPPGAPRWRIEHAGRSPTVSVEDRVATVRQCAMRASASPAVELVTDIAIASLACASVGCFPRARRGLHALPGVQRSEAADRLPRIERLLARRRRCGLPLRPRAGAALLRRTLAWRKDASTARPAVLSSALDGCHTLAALWADDQ